MDEDETVTNTAANETVLMIIDVVNGVAQTKVVLELTPTRIQNEFDAVHWTPETEVRIQTKTDVIAISNAKAGDYSAKWTQDVGNDNFRFLSSDAISKAQALRLLLSLNA